jgi:hypothetical protein
MAAAPKTPASTAPAKKAPAKKAPAKKAPAKKAPAKKVPPHHEEPRHDKAAKAPKPPKAKIVRDSFTMPKPEYAVIDEIKSRVALLGRPAKKSEVLRAGIQQLAALADEELLAAFSGLPEIKTGRPGKG